MTHLDYVSSADPLGPDNRKQTLLVWGIFLIVIGTCSWMLDACDAVRRVLAVRSDDHDIRNDASAPACDCVRNVRSRLAGVDLDRHRFNSMSPVG